MNEDNKKCKQSNKLESFVWLKGSIMCNLCAECPRSPEVARERTNVKVSRSEVFTFA